MSQLVDTENVFGWTISLIIITCSCSKTDSFVLNTEGREIHARALLAQKRKILMVFFHLWGTLWAICGKKCFFSIGGDDGFIFP